MKGSHCPFKIQISLIYYFNFQPSSDMAAFRADFAKAKHIVVLTGAGVSAESGVPTFRGAGGFWRKWQAQVCVLFIVCLFVLLLYVPSQQLWSWLDGQFT